MNASGFTNSIVAVITVVILLALVAIPILNTATANITDTNLKTILGIIPMLMAVGVIIVVINSFIKGKDQ